MRHRTAKRATACLHAFAWVGTFAAIHCVPALAMQSARVSSGFEGGVELGLPTSGGGTFAHTLDVGYGFKTSLPGGTLIGLDRIGFTNSASDQGVTVTVTAARNSLYVRQPFALDPNFAVAGEFGFSNITADASGTNGAQSASASASTGGGLVAGLRGTWGQIGSINANVMLRRYFESGGSNQYGIGASGRIKGALGWQADAYRTGSITTLMIGVRYLGHD